MPEQGVVSPTSPNEPLIQSLQSVVLSARVGKMVVRSPSHIEGDIDSVQLHQHDMKVLDKISIQELKQPHTASLVSTSISQPNNTLDVILTVIRDYPHPQPQ